MSIRMILHEALTFRVGGREKELVASSRMSTKIIQVEKIRSLCMLSKEKFHGVLVAVDCHREILKAKNNQERGKK